MAFRTKWGYLGQLFTSLGRLSGVVLSSARSLFHRHIVDNAFYCKASGGILHNVPGTF